MKNFLLGLWSIAQIAGLAGFAVAADQTWTGRVSGSMCGASDAKIAGQAEMSERDCAPACITGGDKCVFISSGKAYKIANQGLALRQTQAGHTVRLTGETKITVSNVVMPAEK